MKTSHTDIQSDPGYIPWYVASDTSVPLSFRTSEKCTLWSSLLALRTCKVLSYITI